MKENIILIRFASKTPSFKMLIIINKIKYLFEYDCKNFARFVTHIWNKRKERLYV